MSSKGFSHIGLSTHDLDKTRDFYENVLGFKAVRCDIIKIKEGGRIRHMFFEVGRDQLIAFMEPKDVDAIPADYDAGINEGLGVPGPFYHFAFEAGSVAALEAKREELIAKGQTVTDIVDHEWAKSIYLKDPNGISLEFCCLTPATRMTSPCKNGPKSPSKGGSEITTSRAESAQGSRNRHSPSDKPPAYIR